LRIFLLHVLSNKYYRSKKCLDEEREVKVSARVAPSVIAKFFVITSRESRSLRSVVLHVEVV